MIRKTETIVLGFFDRRRAGSFLRTRTGKIVLRVTAVIILLLALPGAFPAIGLLAAAVYKWFH